MTIIINILTKKHINKKMPQYKYLKNIVEDSETIPHSVENYGSKYENDTTMIKYHEALSKIDKILEISSIDNSLIKSKQLEGFKFKLNLVNYADFNSRISANENITVLVLETNNGIDFGSKKSEDEFMKKLCRQTVSLQNSYVFIKSLPYCITVDETSRTDFIDGITYNFIVTTDEALSNMSYSFIAIEETLFNILKEELDFNSVDILFRTNSNSYSNVDDYYFSSLICSDVILEYVEKFPSNLNNEFIKDLKKLLTRNNIRLARQSLLEECESCKI